MFSRKNRFGVVKTNNAFISFQDSGVAEEGGDKETGEEASSSQLDPKKLKVAELRAELEARNLPSQGSLPRETIELLSNFSFSYVGLKPQLIARLEKALQTGDDPTASNGEADEGEDVLMVDQYVPLSQDSEAQQTETLLTEDPQTTEETSQEKLKDEADGDQEMNIAEMDMSEVTIIDEYDSTKCEEEKAEKPREKKEEPRKLDDKERHLIEKRYQLPETPHIIVHPSKAAKGGKFDCTVMSLSVLLDYRPEDTKEHSFEVSLFAELFNEMLTRDFGFNIFNAINYFTPIKVKEESKDDGKKKAADGEATVEGSEAGDKKGNEAEPSKDEGEKKEKKRHEDSDDSLATTSDRSRSKRKDCKEVKVERPKYITAFPDLLLSFVYFDTTHCGYIFEKDLEDLFYTLGLNLSRSQVRKLAEKFVTRDSLYYRKLTDRLAEVPFVNPLENVTEKQLADLARGNKLAKSSGNETENNGQLANVDASGGLVQFNGSLVNIQQLLEQMRRSETARESTERILIDLRQKNGDLTTSNARHDKRIKDLNSDLKSMSRKLQDAESGLSSATVSFINPF